MPVFAVFRETNIDIISYSFEERNPIVSVKIIMAHEGEHDGIKN